MSQWLPSPFTHPSNHPFCRAYLYLQLLLLSPGMVVVRLPPPQPLLPAHAHGHVCWAGSGADAGGLQVRPVCVCVEAWLGVRCLQAQPSPVVPDASAADVLR